MSIQEKFEEQFGKVPSDEMGTTSQISKFVGYQAGYKQALADVVEMLGSEDVSLWASTSRDCAIELDE